jgi:hypothetical protein
MWIGVAVIILMALFPPWLGIQPPGNRLGSIGCHPIYKEPTYMKRSTQTQKSYVQPYMDSRVDYNLLYLQITLVLLITIASILTQTGQRAAKQESQIAARPPDGDC